MPATRSGSHYACWAVPMRAWPCFGGRSRWPRRSETPRASTAPTATWPLALSSGRGSRRRPRVTLDMVAAGEQLGGIRLNGSAFNSAEALVRLGRWDEAEAMARDYGGMPSGNCASTPFDVARHLGPSTRGARPRSSAARRGRNPHSVADGRPVPGVVPSARGPVGHGRGPVRGRLRRHRAGLGPGRGNRGTVPCHGDVRGRNQGRRRWGRTGSSRAPPGGRRQSPPARRRAGGQGRRDRGPAPAPGIAAAAPHTGVAGTEPSRGDAHWATGAQTVGGSRRCLGVAE